MMIKAKQKKPIVESLTFHLSPEFFDSSSIKQISFFKKEKITGSKKMSVLWDPKKGSGGSMRSFRLTLVQFSSGKPSGESSGMPSGAPSNEKTLPELGCL